MLIVAVTGLPGSGKTHWIREQLTQAQPPMMSCIHGNSEALNAVLLDIDQQKVLGVVFPV